MARPPLRRDPLGRWLPRHAAWTSWRAQLRELEPPRRPMLYGDVSRWDPWRRLARPFWHNPRLVGLALGLALMGLGAALVLLGR